MCAFMLTGCLSPASEKNNAESNAAVNDAAPEPQTDWLYETRLDKMSGDTSYFASSNSTNSVEFEFPYNGGSTFRLMVRKMLHGTDVVVLVDKGQFMTNMMGEEQLRVKFDDGKPEPWAYSGARDAGMDIIFPNNPKKFIQRLKTVKKVMIEAPFYNAGRQVMEFDVEGLRWSH